MHDGFRQTLLAQVYDIAKETRVDYAPKMSNHMGRQCYLKREDLQPVHSFKIRGAYNKMRQLTTDEKQKGVIAASAGNHAQGVALSAQKLGLSALIVMPRTTPAIKVEAVKSFGADVCLWGDSYSDAYDKSQQLTKETGRIFIHPFDDPLVIAGQGTIGREILEQLPSVTHIFVSVGGGGLIAGVSQYVKNIRPDIKVIGVEPNDSNAMQLSIQNNRRILLPHVGIFADGVAVKQVGKLTYGICKRNVDDFITVTTDQICAGIKSVFEDTRSIVEPAGAVSIAGMHTYADKLPKDAVAVAVCSGANMTFERLQFVAERTLLGSNKESLFAIELPERPGALQELCQSVINGHSITEFNYRMHRREQAHIFVGVTLHTDAERSNFLKSLQKSGYAFIDLSLDDIAKEHVRHMIGGPSDEARIERLYEINFPERPGALQDFLQVVGTRWNISLFHYRGQGGNIGRVLIGFEAETPHELEAMLEKTKFEFTPVTSQAAQIFIARKD